MLFTLFLALLSCELKRDLGHACHLILLIAVAVSPVVLWVSNELYEEVLLTSLVTSAFICLRRFFADPTDGRVFSIACFLFGAMLATKYQALFFGFLGPVLIYAAFATLPFRAALHHLFVGGLWFAAVGPVAYVRALVMKGVAIYPFSDSWNLLWKGFNKLSFDLPYLLTFETSHFLRPLDATANFAYLMLLPLGLLAGPLFRPNRFSICLLLVTVTYSVAIFSANCYDRYLVYTFPLLALLAVPVLQRGGAVRAVSMTGFAVAFVLNVAALAQDSTFGKAAAWLSPHAPSRTNDFLAATEELNRQVPQGARVLAIGAPFVAGYSYDQVYFMSERAYGFFAATSVEAAVEAAKDLGITHLVRIAASDRRPNADVRRAFLERYGKLIGVYGPDRLYEIVWP